MFPWQQLWQALSMKNIAGFACLSYSISVPYGTEGLKTEVCLHIHSHLTMGLQSEKHTVIGKYLKLGTQRIHPPTKYHNPVMQCMVVCGLSILVTVQMMNPCPASAAQHAKIAFYHACYWLRGNSNQNSKFEVWFLLNMCHIAPLQRVKTLRLNGCELEAIYTIISKLPILYTLLAHYSCVFCICLIFEFMSQQKPVSFGGF